MKPKAKFFRTAIPLATVLALATGSWPAASGPGVRLNSPGKTAAADPGHTEGAPTGKDHPHAFDFPPILVLDEAYGIRPVVRSPGGSIELATVQLSNPLVISPVDPPRDTIPSHSRIVFRWHAEPAVGGSYVVNYLYKLDEPAFVTVDSSVTSVTYNAGMEGGVIAPGIKVFTLRVIDNTGAQREITRHFQMNRGPDTWFAGPDTSALDARYGWSGHDRHLDIANWHALPDLPGSFLDCDSLTRRPAERAASKTFFEIYRDRLYVRTENDTVHMNSWVVFHGGGSDLDSPYDVLVAPNDPALLDSVPCAAAGDPLAVRPAGLVGSPIGFRYLYGTQLDPAGPFDVPAQSLLFPVFDPESAFRQPTIAGYTPMIESGKVYYVLRSADSDGGRDGSIASAGSARLIADHVDAGAGTPGEIGLRPKVLTFYVNRAPFLLVDSAPFVPHPGQVFFSRHVNLNLIADDEDPYDPAMPPPGPGGPSLTKVLRWNLTLRGRDADGFPVSVTPLAGPVFAPQITVDIPSTLAHSDVTVEVQLCDCANCEFAPGSGRCATYQIPILVPPDITGTLASLIAVEATAARVELSWLLSSGGTARVERRSLTSGWTDMGEVLVDGTRMARYEDRTVEAGVRYAYHLVLEMDGRQERVGEVWVDVPRQNEFALEGLRPSPAVGGQLTAHFSLASGEPARLELFDLSGRRLLERSLDSVGPGRHALALRPQERIPPGIYLLRLTQGRNARTVRTAVLD